MFRIAILAAVALTLTAGEPRVLRIWWCSRKRAALAAGRRITASGSWRNEILVGFSAAYFQVKSPDRHQYDNTRPEVPTLARSLDGGETWTLETPASLRPPSQGG